MSETQLNKATFASRVKRIYDGWNVCVFDSLWSFCIFCSFGVSRTQQTMNPYLKQMLFSLWQEILLRTMNPCGKALAFRQVACSSSIVVLIVTHYSNGSWVMSSRPHSSSSKSKRSRFFALLQKVASCLYDVLVPIFISCFAAKVLGQIENAARPVTIEIIARPKGKDTSDALPRFLAAYTSSQKIGVLMKETTSGKLVSEWQALLDGAASKPELVDMTPLVSSLLAIKDDDEMVSVFLSTLQILCLTRTR